jgi:hypothetical protein
MEKLRQRIHQYDQGFLSNDLPEQQQFLFKNKILPVILATDENQQLVTIPEDSAESPEIHRLWSIYPFGYRQQELIIAHRSPWWPKSFDSIHYRLPSEVFTEGVEFTDYAAGRHDWLITSNFASQPVQYYTIRTGLDARISLNAGVVSQGVFEPWLGWAGGVMETQLWAIIPVGN